MSVLGIRASWCSWGILKVCENLPVRSMDGLLYAALCLIRSFGAEDGMFFSDFLFNTMTFPTHLEGLIVFFYFFLDCC
ncbi:hypothetical protein BDW69DRAFT_166410 [Aspergillus filifer]